MRKVKFDLKLNEFGGIAYPDDISFFSETNVIGDHVIGWYSGSDDTISNDDTPDAPDPVEYRTLVTFGELKDLFGVTGFVKVHRAAYPTGSKTPDDMALFFFERAKDPVHPSGKIDLSDPILDQGLQYFKSKLYITDDDITRIKLGVKL